MRSTATSNALLCSIALLLLTSITFAPALAEEAKPAESKPAAATEKPAPPKIELATGIRFVVRPTILGLVPLRDPGNYGEALVRVRGYSEATLLLHYEIRELLAPASAGSPPANAAFRDQSRDMMVIRRGDIGVNGLENSASFSCPLFWGNGSWLTEGSLLWLSRQTFKTLGDTGSAQWNAGFGLETAAPSGFQQYVDELRLAAGLGATAPIELRLAKWDSGCPCVVNGERVILPCIYAVDNIGLAEYWILDNADNPLIMKMSYLPRKGFALQGNAAGEELNFGEVAQSGGGYAITEINF